MHPNKRGPVELQLREMARQSRERGWPMTICFPAEPPEWYAEDLAATGCECKVIPGMETEAGMRSVLAALPRGGDAVVHLHFVTPRMYAAPLRQAGVRAIVRTEIGRAHV